AIGLAVCLGAGLATGAILVAVLKRTTGLVVGEEVEVAGFDAAYWEIVHDLDPAPAAVAVVEQAAEPPAASGNGEGAATERGPTTV
ncbi:MAG: hypothetical protein ABW060_05030, partial [Solirubrobacteraceae bacterium]